MIGARLKRRLAACGALLAYLVSALATVETVSDGFAVLLGACVLVAVAVVAGWVAITRRGLARWSGIAGAVVALGGLAVLLVDHEKIRDLTVIVVAWLVATVLAKYAVGIDVATLTELPPPGERMPRPSHPVLLMNPWSGGGKVESFHLVEESRRRGIEPVVLQRGDDLETLAQQAVARGADVLGMAGGDGSQAIVAGVAMEHDLPYVCVPAGTRNHLALDLGVDRADVVAALDAFVDGYERRIDLARVNGRVFVNNVSLGVYARIVQSEEYRDQKMQTAANMLPDLLGPGEGAFDFELTDSQGAKVSGPCLVLVSNNVYRLDRLGGFGSRARIDEGVLGVVTVAVANAAAATQLVALETVGQIRRAAGWRDWTAQTLTIDSGSPVEVGVDGEAMTLPPPLQFEIVPNALRVRVARSAPGTSAAAIADAARRTGPATLLRVAFGHDTRLQASSD